MIALYSRSSVHKVIPRRSRRCPVIDGKEVIDAGCQRLHPMAIRRRFRLGTT
ncbi:MAG: hypothetical protein MZU97_25830 [Bacillus subtilis]|nr:hypothetical protein [Bacillus subtilis]